MSRPLPIFQNHFARLPLRTRCGGFSVLEMVVTIALIGVLSAIVLSFGGSMPRQVKNEKLKTDVVTINQLIGIYIADGGNFNGISDPQKIIDQLKKTRSSSDMRRHTNVVTGSLVDVRLKAKIVSGARATDVPGRALWNAAKKRFEVSPTNATGVEEFFLDDALASIDYGVETSRKTASRVKYNGSSGWIWGSTTDAPLTYKAPTYADPTGTDNPFNPTEPAVSSGGSGSGGSGSGGSGSGSGGSGSGAGVVQLPTPVISPDGGSFASGTMPGSASISSNGAPGGASKLQYQKNGGAWQDYVGAIPLASGDSVAAKNTSLDTVAYSDSAVTSENYFEYVSSFNGGGVGSWGNVTGGSNLIQTTTNGDPTSTLQHGNTKLDLGNGQYLDAGVENVISFTKNDFAGAAPNTWFNLGNMSMLNGTTFYDSQASGATLTLNMTLTDPATTGPVHIDLGFTNTENSSDRLASADIVELQSPSTDLTTTIGGVVYRLELSWATLDPTKGVVQGNQFLIFEGETAQAQLLARFVSDR